MQQQQQVLEFALPNNEQARRRRMTEIRSHWFCLVERIEHLDGLLTLGRRRRVVGFLKRLLKSEMSSWDGTVTFRQKWLANDWNLSESTLANWLRWAKQAGAIEWTIDADESGIRRTTLQFTWAKLANKCGIEPLPTNDSQTDNLSTDQTSTVADQTSTVADQTSTVADQTSTVEVYSGCSVSGSSTEADWTAAADVLRDSGLKFVDQAIREAQQLEHSPADVIRAVETYQANRAKFDDAGAIRFFLRNGQWPVKGEVQEPEVIAASRQAKAARDAAAQAEHEKRQAERDVWRGELAALEAAYGAQLDALDDDDMYELARLTFETQFEFDSWKRSKSKSGFGRYELLAAIHERKASCDYQDNADGHHQIVLQKN